MNCIVNDLPIYYEEHGQGKPILCLHGFPEDHKSMKGCLEPFFSQHEGYRRIYLDLPGMGKTPGADWIKNADDMLDLLKKFVGEIIGDEGFLLAATSYGGYLALGLAYDVSMKIDGMFLFGPVTVAGNDKRKLPDEVEGFVEDCLEASISADDKEGFGYFLDDSYIATSYTWQRYKNEILPAYTINKSWASDFCKNYRKNGFAFTFDEQLKDLQYANPITVLTGRQDESVGCEDAWDRLKHLPKLTFVALDGVGHMMQIESPDAFNFHLKEWLGRINTKLQPKQH